MTLEHDTTIWLRQEAMRRYGRVTGLGRIVDDLVKKERERAKQAR